MLKNGRDARLIAHMHQWEDLVNPLFMMLDVAFPFIKELRNGYG
jgi:hypothetical protein